jgi:hypothetical protein
MLALGVFGGKYMTDCQKEFPATWFAHAKLSPRGRDCSLNYFGVDASQPLSMWRRKGWVHLDDPRGLVPMVLPLLHGPRPGAVLGPARAFSAPEATYPTPARSARSAFLHAASALTAGS